LCAGVQPDRPHLCAFWLAALLGALEAASSVPARSGPIAALTPYVFNFTGAAVPRALRLVFARIYASFVTESERFVRVLPQGRVDTWGRTITIPTKFQDYFHDCLLFVAVIGADPWLVAPAGGTPRRDEAATPLNWRSPRVRALDAALGPLPYLKKLAPCSEWFDRGMGDWRCSWTHEADGAVALEHAILDIRMFARGSCLVGSAFGALAAPRTVEHLLASWVRHSAAQLLRQDSLATVVRINAAGNLRRHSNDVMTEWLERPTRDVRCRFVAMPYVDAQEPDVFDTIAKVRALGATHLPVRVAMSVSPEQAHSRDFVKARALDAAGSLPPGGACYADVVPSRRVLCGEPDMVETRVADETDLLSVMLDDATLLVMAYGPTGVLLMTQAALSPQAPAPPLELARLPGGMGA
jgi:hypothetical protein